MNAAILLHNSIAIRVVGAREHNLAVTGQADWIIDLGPDGGKNGGEIVFTGTPEQLVGAEGSLTREYLRRYQPAILSPKNADPSRFNSE